MGGGRAATKARNSSHKGAKVLRNTEKKIRISKSEIRNPKQIQMIKTTMFQLNGKDRIRVLDFSDFGFICTLVCFGFRDWDFGFVSLVAWRDKFSCCSRAGIMCGMG
jgi:hypothetical protein